MSRSPISREELLSEIGVALSEADDDVREQWERMHIEPQKWRCSPWGDEGGGFWVVAELEGRVVWYNDIELGFNISTFSTRGVIDEYVCNQGDFRDFLLTLPVAQAAAGFADEEPMQGVPSRARGPGRIERRQTTYWELQTASGNTLRVHFSDKHESRFRNDHYADMTLTREHPLLRHYHEAWKELYVSQAQQCVAVGFVTKLLAAMDAACHGVRPAADYLASDHLESMLLQGDGLLLRAPESVARAAADVVKAFGARASLLDGQPAQPDLQLLVLGDNHIVARAFRFA